MKKTSMASLANMFNAGAMSIAGTHVTPGMQYMAQTGAAAAEQAAREEMEKEEKKKKKIKTGRTVGKVAGALIGTAVGQSMAGAALGSALGGAAGGLVTGQKPGSAALDTLVESAPMVLSYGAGKLADAIDAKNLPSEGSVEQWSADIKSGNGTLETIRDVRASQPSLDDIFNHPGNKYLTGLAEGLRSVDTGALASQFAGMESYNQPSNMPAVFGMQPEQLAQIENQKMERKRLVQAELEKEKDRAFELKLFEDKAKNDERQFNLEQSAADKRLKQQFGMEKELTEQKLSYEIQGDSMDRAARAEEGRKDRESQEKQTTERLQATRDAAAARGKGGKGGRDYSVLSAAEQRRADNEDMALAVTMVEKLQAPDIPSALALIHSKGSVVDLSGGDTASGEVPKTDVKSGTKVEPADESVIYGYTKDGKPIPFTSISLAKKALEKGVIVRFSSESDEDGFYNEGAARPGDGSSYRRYR